MTVTNGYCTVPQMREHFGDELSGHLQESKIERAIEAASRGIDRYCDRRFWLDADVSVRTYPVVHPYQVWVDDIGSTSGVIVKTDPNKDASWSVTWAATDYQLGPLNANVVASGDTVTPWSFRRIDAIGDYYFPVAAPRATLQVTARFGWSSVPDDVAEACILKAASLFKRKDAPFGVLGMNDFGAVRIGRNDPDVVSLLAPYRRLAA